MRILAPFSERGGDDTSGCNGADALDAGSGNERLEGDTATMRYPAPRGTT